jgi:hypothetical protein
MLIYLHLPTTIVGQIKKCWSAQNKLNLSNVQKINVRHANSSVVHNINVDLGQHKRWCTITLLVNVELASIYIQIFTLKNEKCREKI